MNGILELISHPIWDIMAVPKSGVRWFPPLVRLWKIQVERRVKERGGVWGPGKNSPAIETS
jgi:hypothetical protein